MTRNTTLTRTALSLLLVAATASPAASQSGTTSPPPGSGTTPQPTGSGTTSPPPGSGTTSQPAGSGTAPAPAGSGSTMQPAGGTAFAIDPSHTSVVFGIGHAGIGFVYGRFNTVSGSFTQAGEELTGIELMIDAASVDTNESKRDEHLRSPDFFNVAQFPAITFKSRSLKKVGSKYEVTGDLTIHGVTRPVVIPVQKLKEGQGPFGAYRSGLFAQFAVKRTEYGMSNMLEIVGDPVTLTVAIEGIKQ
ncbi:MAG: YceI family protein [Planctomycetota bacterium]